jgi:DNA replication protein DnaC
METLGEILTTMPLPQPSATAGEDSAVAGLQRYECERCHDVGWLMDDEEWERNGYRGGLVLCPECGEVRQRQRLQRLSGLSAEMQRWTFANFRRREGNRKALAAARQAVAQPRGSILLWGDWGTGKTRLLATVVNECRGRRIAAVYTTAADLLDQLRETFNRETGEDFGSRWQTVRMVRVLALDEVDKVSPTAWAIERIVALIDARYRRLRECLTLVATNSRVEDGWRLIPGAGAMEGSIESRLTDGRCKVIELKGGDLRPSRTWDDD